MPRLAQSSPSPPHAPPAQTPRVAGLAVALLLACAALSGLALLLADADRGFDITDEAFYVANIIDRAGIRIVPVDFGVYFALFGEDVADIRRRSLLALAILCGALGVAASRLCRRGAAGRAAGADRIAFASAAVVAGLASKVQWWVLTPSYNTLSLFGALTMAVGVLLHAGGAPFARPFARPFAHPFARPFGRPFGRAGASVALAVLVGLGMFLSFVGRPTSAAPLGLATLIFVVFLSGWRRALLLGGASAATAFLLLMLHAVATDGGPLAYLRRIQLAVELALHLDGGHGLSYTAGWLATGLRDLATRLTWGHATGLAAVLVALVGTMVVADRLHPASRPVLPTLLALTSIGAVAYTAWYWDARYGLSWARFLGAWASEAIVVLFALAAAAAALRLGGPAPRGTARSGNAPAGRSRHDGRLRARLAGSGLYLAAMGALLPMGSNTEWSISVGAGYVFFVLALALLARSAAPAAPRFLIACLMAVALVPVALAALETRRAPLRLVAGIEAQTVPVRFLGNPTRLRVDPDTARWVEALQAAARAGRWRVGTPLLDLTGGTPGAAVVLGAHAPVTPWLVGGYRGSSDFATFALRHAARDDLKAAWVLTAPDGSRALPASVLTELGLSFPRDYVEVGRVTTGWRAEAQTLWRPRAND